MCQENNEQFMFVFNEYLEIHPEKKQLIFLIDTEACRQCAGLEGYNELCVLTDIIIDHMSLCAVDTNKLGSSKLRVL